MSEHHSRRVFLRRSAALATGLAALPLLSDAARPQVADAQSGREDAARASELYAAMQKNFYLADSKLYLETSPRARSRPYAYLWPFYEAMAGTVDLYGLNMGTYQTAVDDRLTGLKAYWRPDAVPNQQPPLGGYDSYPLVDGGGDRYNDDNAWIGRAMVQLHRMGYTSTQSPTPLETTPLERAQQLFDFIKASWDTTGTFQKTPNPGGVYWVQQPAGASGGKDRGTGPTGGFAKLALHLSSAPTDTDPYFTWGRKAYEWVNANLLNRATNLYWDKILADNQTMDTRYWSYNQGVMIGAGVLLAGLTKSDSYLTQASETAKAAIAHYNSVGWYTQPVIFNSLFFRNLLLLYAVRSDAQFLEAAQKFADGVWNNPRIHNMRTHMIKFEERTSAYKLREQAGMVQLYACLAWVGKKNLLDLA